MLNRRTLRPGILVATLRAAVPTRVTLHYPTGVQQQLVVTSRGTNLRRILQLRPGSSTIRISATPVDPRVAPGRMELRAQHPAVLEAGFAPFL